MVPALLAIATRAAHAAERLDRLTDCTCGLGRAPRPAASHLPFGGQFAFSLSPPPRPPWCLGMEHPQTLFAALALHHQAGLRHNKRRAEMKQGIYLQV